MRVNDAPQRNLRYRPSSLELPAPVEQVLVLDSDRDPYNASRPSWGVVGGVGWPKGLVFVHGAGERETGMYFTRRRQQSGKRAKKHTQKDKQRSKKKRSDASDLDSDSNRSGSDSNSGEAGPGVDEEFKAAARAIARCVDMFCNVEKVIK
ncbi:hypothetical protein PAXINDRAFT_159054, partial [Paxillus involutus ATCC 200175]